MPERFKEGDMHRGKEVANIHSRSENPDAKILSNLARTPFNYGGYNFQCVEAALQGIKFKDREQRERVFKMSGREALAVGRKITNSIKAGEKRFVYWNDIEIVYNSDEHRDLLKEFIKAKIRQNPDVQTALLNLGDNFIYHYVGEESKHTSLPEKIYIQTLISERERLEYLASLKEDFQKGYNEGEEPTYAITRKSIVDKLTEELRDRTQSKQVIVLDVGANDQRLEQELFVELEKKAISKPHVIASDIIKMSADNSSKEISTIQTDALDLAILSEKVDIVISNFTLNYLPKKALEESYRVLKNDGTIICTFHDLKALKEIEREESMEEALNEEEKEDREKFKFGYDRHSINDNNIDKIKKYFEDVGFQDIVVEKKKGEEEGRMISWFEIQATK